VSIIHTREVILFPNLTKVVKYIDNSSSVALKLELVLGVEKLLITWSWIIGQYES